VEVTGESSEQEANPTNGNDNCPKEVTETARTQDGLD
jgi:hypothetical protein